jgi:hypothetical protein
MLRAIKTTVLVAGLALVASGCGGSGGESALTKKEFVRQASAICKKANEGQYAAFAAAGKKGTAENTSAQEDLLVNGELPPLQKEAEELADLGAPTGDEGEVEAITSGIEEAVEAVEKNPSGILAEEGQNPFLAVNKLIAKYGLTECSTP